MSVNFYLLFTSLVNLIFCDSYASQKFRRAKGKIIFSLLELNCCLLVLIIQYKSFPALFLNIIESSKHSFDYLLRTMCYCSRKFYRRTQNELKGTYSLQIPWYGTSLAFIKSLIVKVLWKICYKNFEQSTLLLRSKNIVLNISLQQSKG